MSCHVQREVVVMDVVDERCNAGSRERNAALRWLWRVTLGVDLEFQLDWRARRLTRARKCGDRRCKFISRVVRGMCKM